MANFNLVVDTSSFKPFTYDEISKPLILYKQELEAREKAYLDLYEKASSLEALANLSLDAEVYNAYLAYKQKLDDVVSDMAKNGLTIGNNQVFDLRKQFINEIKPWNELMEKRNELIKELRLNNKDNTNMYSVDYSTIPLAEMRNMPTHTYNTINGMSIMQISAAKFSPLAKQILSNPTIAQLNPLYLYIQMLKGVPLEQLLAGLGANDEANVIYQMKQSIKNSIGANAKGFSPELEAQIDAWIDAGAMSALGETDIKPVESGEYIDKYKREALLLSKDEFEWKKNHPEHTGTSTKVPEGKPQGYSSAGFTKDSIVSSDIVSYTSLNALDKARVKMYFNSLGISGLSEEDIKNGADYITILKETSGTKEDGKVTEETGYRLTISVDTKSFLAAVEAGRTPSPQIENPTPLEGSSLEDKKEEELEEVVPNYATDEIRGDYVYRNGKIIGKLKK